MEIQERVRDLSNDELKNLLLQYGYQSGPVVGTTRRVYENKLVKFVQEALSSGAASPLVASPSPAQPTPHLTNGSGDDVVIINGYGEVLEASPKKKPGAANVSSQQGSPSSQQPLFPTTPEKVPEDDRMEGEESFRFVSPPTFNDDNDEFSPQVTRIRQRNIIPSNRLYPDLNEELTTGARRSLQNRLDDYQSLSAEQGNTNYKSNVSARSAQPRDVYGTAKRSSFSLYIKVLIALLLTVFLVMFLRRIGEEEILAGERPDDIFE